MSLDSEDHADEDEADMSQPHGFGTEIEGGSMFQTITFNDHSLRIFFEGDGAEFEFDSENELGQEMDGESDWEDVDEGGDDATESDDDADDFLESDEEDSKSDESTDSDEDSDDGEGLFDTKPRHRNSRYRLEALHPMDLALLRVNWQIYNETRPIFYGGVSFILDVQPLAAIRFFKTLPLQDFQSITSITITSEALLADDQYVREAWSWAETSLYKGPPAMMTRFGAFVALEMPKLDEVFMYVPYRGHEDWYCSLAPVEMEMLVAHDRIERLCLVFLGEEAALDLRDERSDSQCFRNMMGLLRTLDITHHELEVLNPAPQRSDSESFNLWLEKRGQFHENRDKGRKFCYRWGDRDVDMGSDGNVQAVLQLWIDHSDAEVETT